MINVHCIVFEHNRITNNNSYREDVLPSIETMDICRVCMSTSQNMNLIFSNSDNSLVKKILLFADIKLNEDDGLPDKICNVCFNWLGFAWLFKTTCESSDKKLRATQIKHHEPLATGVFVSIETARRSTRGKLDRLTVPDEECQPVVMNADPVEKKFPIENKHAVHSDRVLRKCPPKKNDRNKSNRLRPAIQLNSTSDPITGAPTTLHECEKCRATFKTQSTLSKHLKIHSVNFKPHECLVCKKLFRHKVALQVHTRIHTGERPYVCETCGKSFIQLGTLSSHTLTHTKVKAFKCATCPYNARTQSDLNRHIRIHTGVQPYQCTFCPKRFTTSSNFFKHKRMHLGEKKFKCEHCPKSFISAQDVSKHMVTHTGAKPYACQFCFMVFGWSKGLRKHMKRKHPENLQTNGRFTIVTGTTNGIQTTYTAKQ